MAIPAPPDWQASSTVLWRVDRHRGRTKSTFRTDLVHQYQQVDTASITNLCDIALWREKRNIAVPSCDFFTCYSRTLYIYIVLEFLFRFIQRSFIEATFEQNEHENCTAEKNSHTEPHSNLRDTDVPFRQSREKTR